MTLNNIENENFEVLPESIYPFFDKDNEIIGCLIIDATINGISGGGVRIVNRISRFELSHLAKTMTLKYSFLNFPFGGAKAAIITNREGISEEEKVKYIESFSENLISLKNKYMPGKDIGIDDKDYHLMLKTAHLRKTSSTPDSAYYTALTLLICAEEIAGERGIDLQDCTIAIEGFGKVGSWVARHLSETGCKVIAVSTSSGAVYDPEGLNIVELLRLKETFGSDCVLKYKGGKRIGIEDLLTLEMDFLIPCAGSWSINLSNVEKIQAKIILCGANNPVTDMAKQVLIDKGVLYCPDFVSNCGGVLGSIMETIFLNREKTGSFIRREFTPKIQNVIRLSKIQNEPLEKIAKDIAMANFNGMKEQEGKGNSKFLSIALKIFRQGFIPWPLIRLFGPIYIKKALNNKPRIQKEIQGSKV